jgi:hypothetical protein
MSILKKKYRIIPFCEVKDTNVPFVILRHDVDASLEAALKMATLEKSLGIRSTYFVLFSHKLYNLLEKDSLTMLKEISGQGHEIGLHYDVETYESYGQSMKKTLMKEVSLLENLLNKRCFSIACHNVSILNSEDPFKNIKEYINAYDPRFCEVYVSDSCRAWRIEYLSRLLNFSFKRGQLLTHPFLWAEDVCERETVLYRLFEGIENRNRDYKLKWLEFWRKSLKINDYDKRIKKSSESNN